MSCCSDDLSLLLPSALGSRSENKFSPLVGPSGSSNKLIPSLTVSNFCRTPTSLKFRLFSPDVVNLVRLIKQPDRPATVTGAAVPLADSTYTADLALI